MCFVLVFFFPILSVNLVVATHSVNVRGGLINGIETCFVFKLLDISTVFVFVQRFFRESLVKGWNLSVKNYVCMHYNLFHCAHQHILLFL